MSKKINPMIYAAVLYIVGTIVGQGVTFLGTIVFTRVMSRENYGLYSTYYSVMAILEVLVGSNLYVSLQNAYIDYKHEVKQYRKACLFLSSIVCAIISVAVLGVRAFFFPEVPLYMVLFALIHAYAFFVVNYRMYCDNMEYAYKKKLLLLVLPALLQFIFALCLVINFQANMLMARIVGSALGVGVCGLVAYISIMKSSGRIVIPDYWKYGLAISCPSVMMSLSYMIMQQCDKVMITFFCGAEDTAVYSVIYYLGYAITAVSQGVGAVFQAWIYRAIDRQEFESVKNVQKWYVILVMAMETGILMLSPEIIKIIAPQEYWQYEYVGPFVLGASMMFLYGLYTTIGLFFKRTGKISMCVLTSALTNIILNAILIPQFGAVAACYTTVASYILLFFMAKRIGDKEIQNLYDIKILYRFMFFSIISCCVFLMIMNNLTLRILIYGLVLVVLCIYSGFKAKEIKGFIWKV